MRNRCFKTFRIDDILMPMTLNFFKQGKPFDTIYFFFSGCIDGKNDKQVRLVERTGEVIKKRLGSGITMRLEHRYNPPVRPAFPCGLQGGFNLRRVMAVIVNNGNPLFFTFNFQPPLNTFRSLERRFYNVKGYIEFDAYSDACQGIVNIMNTWKIQ